MSTVILETILLLMKKQFLLYWVSWALGLLRCFSGIYENNLSHIPAPMCPGAFCCLIIHLPFTICPLKAVFSCNFHVSLKAHSHSFFASEGLIRNYAVSLSYVLVFSAFLYKCRTKHWIMNNRYTIRGKICHMLYKW